MRVLVGRLEYQWMLELQYNSHVPGLGIGGNVGGLVDLIDGKLSLRRPLPN